MPSQTLWAKIQPIPTKAAGTLALARSTYFGCFPPVSRQ